MPDIISKCGIDCGTCPWGPFPRRNMSSTEFEEYKNKAKKILGYMPIKTPCVTCLTPNDKIPKKSKLPSRKCLIRQCVDLNGIANCAYCSRFPCDSLKETAGLWTRKKIETKLKTHISENDYFSFVKPFEGIDRLNNIRNSLTSDEIKEPKKLINSKIKISKFPENLLPNKEVKSFKTIYNLLIDIKNSSLDLKDTDTFAQKQKLKKQKKHIFRLLWILGTYGKLIEKDLWYLEVDAKTFQNNRKNEKTLAILSFVQNVVFKALCKFGIYCEIIVLEGSKNEELTTNTGYLGKKGWNVRMCFDKKIGGSKTLRAFQTYVKVLNKKIGSRGLERFQKADMNVLLNT
jgi:hypothetical protein